jgi:phosphoesterase RecJ-like protein
MSIQKAIEIIKNSNNFLITTHTNMEGDALGSVLAFYRMVKAMGKRAVVVTEDDIPYGYEFLPAIDKLKKLNKNFKDTKFDCFVVLDCSDLKRTGQVYKINHEHKPILNIDHHISNVKFGAVNWVEPYASSCSEMVYNLYKKIKVPLDKKSALLLYAGILTDTGSFRYSNTNSRTHFIVSELLEYGIKAFEVYNNLYANIPFKDMQLLARILPKMKQSQKGKVIWFEIQKGLIKKQKKIFIDLSEHVLNFGRSVKDAEIVILFKENFTLDGQVRVNFRSKGKYDVNKIAQFFGGGGHRTASGCTIKGSLTCARKKVLNKVKSAFNNS